MREHEDALYLVYIWQMAHLIYQSVADESERLKADPDVRDATFYRLQTLAESTQRLSPELKDRHPDIPWREIASMRNHLVHGYQQVQTDLVWKA